VRVYKALYTRLETAQKARDKTDPPFHLFKELRRSLQKRGPKSNKILLSFMLSGSESVPFITVDNIGAKLHVC